MRFVLPLLLSVALLAGACGDDDTVVGDPGATGGGAGALADQWLLTALTGPDGALTLPDGDLRVRIGDGEIGGDLGCNSFFGEFVAGDDGSITIGALGQTEMACEDQSRMEFEFEYGRILGGVTAWTLDGATLTLTGEGTTVVYERFVPVHQPLEGTVWHFDSLFEGDAVTNSSAMEGVTLTIEDSEVTLESPLCRPNSFNVDVDEGAVTWSGEVEMPTILDCEIVDTAHSGLFEADRYEIVENRLTFFAGDSPTVGFSARP